MRLVWKSVDAPPRNWRSIAKALILIDHLIRNGAEKVVGDVQHHIHDIAFLTEFRYLDGNLDRGRGGMLLLVLVLVYRGSHVFLFLCCRPNGVSYICYMCFGLRNFRGAPEVSCAERICNVSL